MKLLGQLRARLSELPRDRDIHVICRSGGRAYYATRILLQHGFKARTLAGGMLFTGLTGMFLLLVFVDVFGFLYAFKTGVAFDVALNNLWDDDSQIIFSSIIAFYFGGQAFKR